MDHFNFFFFFDDFSFLIIYIIYYYGLKERGKKSQAFETLT